MIGYSYYMEFGPGKYYPSENFYHTEEEAIEAARSNDEIISDDHFGIEMRERNNGFDDFVKTIKECRKRTYEEDLIGY